MTNPKFGDLTPSTKSPDKHCSTPEAISRNTTSCLIALYTVTKLN